MILPAVVLVPISLGIGYLHYREMVTPIPEFESLRPIPADGMRYQMARPRGPSGDVGFEFTDQGGTRYQTGYMAAEQARAIKDALDLGGVVLFVGRWKSAIPSNSIFSVYHMTSGDRVLIDYKTMAANKEKEQEGAVPVVVASFLLIVGIVIFVSWKQYKRLLGAS